MEQEIDNFKMAQLQVKKIKQFYEHLFTFLIMVPLFFMMRFYVLPKLGFITQNENFNKWLDWNTYLMPLFWLGAIGIHAYTVFGAKWLKSWEEQTIQKIVTKEENSNRSNWK